MTSNSNTNSDLKYRTDIRFLVLVLTLILNTESRSNTKFYSQVM